jgi:DNA primase
MAGGFSQGILEEIRSRIDIVELVGQWVRLKGAGQNYKGLCPFHAEKTPSFTVNPRRGIYHCFGCGAGGDAFGFVMRQDRLGFPEAVRMLAERAGVALPDERPAGGAGDGKLEALRRAMAAAQEFFGERLWSPQGDRPRRYLAERGVDLEVARRFGLGYAPEGWTNLLTALGKLAGEEVLVQAGLVAPRQSSPGFYDRFRGRLTFPIRDPQGRVVAFGARALSAGDEPKYLNSPETPLYSKGQTLYALDLARETMRARGRAIVVEGYLDCLMAHQHGFAETVAALGTAFTGAQLALLRRHADEVVALFDADAAGQKASTRLEELLGEGGGLRDLGWSVTRTGDFARPGHFAVKVALLPAGHDPDSLLRSEGPPALEASLRAARPALAFALDRALAAEDLDTARGRAAAHARVTLVLSRVANAQEATELAREAAQRLGVDETQLWIEAQQLMGARSRNPRPPAQPEVPAAGAAPAADSFERDLVTLLITMAEARAELLALVEPSDVAHPGLRALVVSLKESGAARPEALMASLEGDDERRLLASLLVEERTWPELQNHVDELRRRYYIRRRKERVRQVTQAIARAQAAGDPAPPDLEAELRSLQQEAEAVRELVLARQDPDPGRTSTNTR